MLKLDPHRLNRNFKSSLFIGFGLYAILGITFLAYQPGLSGPFLLDDFPQLMPLIKNIDIQNWFDKWPGYLFSDSGRLGRPVAMASFIFNATTCYGDVACWKYANLIVHLLIGALIFLLTAKLVNLSGPSSESSYLFALFVSALWLLHPIHISTVLYTVQRMAELSTLFTIIGLIVYVTGRRRQLDGHPNGMLYVIASFIVFGSMATLSKENGVLFPVFALVFELCFFHFRGNRFEQICLASLSLAPILVACCYALAHFDELILKTYESRPFTMTQRLLTELRVVAYYVYELLLPWKHNLGFFHDDFVVSRNWIQPPTTVFSAAFLLLFMLAAIINRNTNPLFSFGVLLFFSSHLLESTIVPLELMFEHRNYLASYGLLLGLSGLVFRQTISVQWKTSLAIAVIAFCGITTFFTARIWGSPDSLYPYLLEAHPDSPRLASIFGNSYAAAGRFDEARSWLNKHDGFGFTLNGFDIDCLQYKQIPDEEFDHASAQLAGFISVYEVEGMINLANRGLDDECEFSSEKYLALLDEVLGKKIIDAKSAQKLWLYKAHYLHELNKPGAAISALDESFKAFPKNPIPLFLAAEWLAQQRELKFAHTYFEHAKGVAQSSLKDYSEFVQRVGDMLATR